MSATLNPHGDHDSAAATAAAARNVMWTYVNWASSVAAPLILIPLYVRLLGHELYGQWLVIFSLASYLGLANLGTWQAIGNRITEAVADHRSGEVGTLVSTGFIAYSAVIAVLAVTVVGATPFVWHRLAPGTGAQAAWAFAVFIALSAAAFPFKAHSIMLRSFQRVDLEQKISASANLGRIAVMAAALIAGMKLLAIAAIQGGAMLAQGIAAYASALRVTPDARPALSRFSRATVRSIAAPSAGFLGLTVASTIAFGVDNLVIGWALGASAVTRYAVPFRLITMLAGIFAVGVGAFWPAITAAYARDEHERLRTGFLLLTRISILAAAIAGFALWFAGPGFIRLWAGEGVFPGRTVFGLQVALMMIQILVTPADAVLMATSRHYLYAMLAIVECALNLALSLWWVRYWGLAGVIAGTIAARLVTNGWYMPAAALRTMHLSGAALGRKVAPMAALCAAAIAATVIVPRDTAPTLGIFVAGLLLAGAAAIAFSNDERRAGLGAIRTWISHRQPA
jgi:O-antigen/teichoic acid export membrane protein